MALATGAKMARRLGGRKCAGCKATAANPAKTGLAGGAFRFGDVYRPDSSAHVPVLG